PRASAKCPRGPWDRRCESRCFHPTWNLCARTNAAESPRRQERSQPAKDEARLPLRLRDVEPHVWEPLQQCRERNLDLDARELRAEAKVDAVAERQRPDVLARQVQPVRIGKHRRIAIGRSEYGDNRVALADPLSAELDVLEGAAAAELDRRAVAQQLLHT